jgi:outer membrane protein OmpA-like peptidoglycan-associated protein
MSGICPWRGIGTVGKKSPLPDIQRQDKLETDLGAAAGLTCPVSTEKLNHQNASLDITFDLGGSVLTAEDINNITVFVNNWHGASVSVPVRIHGYASKDGAPTRNWPLSCQRAEAVSKQMQKVQPAVVLSTGQAFPAGTPGIPAGFVDTFAHGETEEFSKATLPPNRRATVHVPSLPSLPAKVAKAPTARLKSGPTYTPNGTIKATATPLKKSASFRMSAEFDQDPPNGVLSACGQVRQYLRWSSNDVDPARFGHEGFFTDKTYLPNTWYEDRDQPNTRYGHRSGPHSALKDAFDQYFDKAGKKAPNPVSGRFYEGSDSPNTSGSAAYIASFVGTWEFRLDAINTCSAGGVLGSDTVKIVW